MKKILVTGLVLFSSAAFAADINVCTGASTSENGTPVTDTNSAFVVSTFTPKCSANVFLKSGDDSTAVWVGSVSTKGKTAFKGNSNGGGVVANGACAATPCVEGDATTARTEAAADASAT